MKTEHYDPPIADEQAEYERAAELHHAASKIHEKLLSEIEKKKSLFSVKLEELDELQRMAMIAESRADLASEEIRFYEEEVELATQSLVTLEGFICELIKKEEEE